MDSEKLMNWTHEQLKALGYRQNPDGSYSHTSTAGLPYAQPQPAARPTLVNPREGKDPSQTRTTLCITRHATKLLDADNFAGGCKPLIDQLRYAKLIADDDPETVEILFRQTKVKTKAEERTEVEIRAGGF